LGIGDWAQSPIPNPQSPIPNKILLSINKDNIKLYYFLIYLNYKIIIIKIINIFIIIYFLYSKGST